MSRGFNNWNAAQVIKFLKSNSFIHTHSRGSHFYYTAKIDDVDRQVCVPVHGGASLHPKVMKSIVRQSGLLEKQWLR